VGCLRLQGQVARLSGSFNQGCCSQSVLLLFRCPGIHQPL
jgi:hypothetical protein